jgi:TIR domain
MAHDVFISHARKDKRVADSLCEKLESTGVRCWIAERDVTAGDDWTEATRKAIGSSRVMVLVLSENANAAAHIEREIAHAFYTRRTIVPLRLTNAPPRRDFLFYLGGVRWFDAFGLPAERQMEALIESISGIVHGPNAPPPAMVPSPEKPPTARVEFSDSWTGALEASHYRALGILKRVAVAASLLGGVGLLWFVFGQTEQEIPGARLKRPATFPEPGAAPDAKSPTTSEAPASNPAYVYSRFGLWVEPNPASTPSGQHSPLEIPSPAPLEQPVSAAASSLPETEKPEDAEVESPGPGNEASERSAGRDHMRLANRQEVHRKKVHPKHHTRKVPASDESFVEHIHSGLKRVWHQIVGQSW